MTTPPDETLETRLRECLECKSTGIVNGWTFTTTRCGYCELRRDAADTIAALRQQLAESRQSVFDAPMAAGYLLFLKQECEAQHARAQAAEARVSTLEQLLKKWLAPIHPEFGASPNLPIVETREALGVKSPTEEPQS